MDLPNYEHHEIDADVSPAAIVDMSQKTPYEKLLKSAKEALVADTPEMVRVKISALLADCSAKLREGLITHPQARALAAQVNMTNDAATSSFFRMPTAGSLPYRAYAAQPARRPA
jgi:hypothetical protein